MKRFATFLLVLAMVQAWPARAQQYSIPDPPGKSAKIAKQQQKMYRKAAIKQQKAMKKAAKAQQKADRKAAKQNAKQMNRSAK
jgi:hypothetical protein